MGKKAGTPLSRRDNAYHISIATKTTPVAMNRAIRNLAVGRTVRSLNSTLRRQFVLYRGIVCVTPKCWRIIMNKILILAGAAALAASPLLADFTYQETSTITGGAVMSMLKVVGVFSKQAREPIVSTISV